MEFIKDYRAIAEFVYFLCGPLMLLGIIVGVFQIFYFKKDMSIRVTREATLMSLSVLEKKINELNDYWEFAFDDERFPDRPGFEGEVNGLYLSKLVCSNDFVAKMNAPEHMRFSNAITRCLWCLENLAQYINSGICDEEKCYKLEGPVVVSYVESLKEFIALDRESEDDHVYENIVSLYNIWVVRLEHDNLLKKSQEIKSKLDNAQRPAPLKIIGG